MDIREVMLKATSKKFEIRIYRGREKALSEAQPQDVAPGWPWDGVKFFENNTDKKSGFRGPKCFTDQMIKGAKDR